VDKMKNEKVKVIFRKNLKMTPQKLAAQVAHAVVGLGITDPLCTIVVLHASDKKFFELIERDDCYVHVDAGYTEVEPGTKTCAAWIETKVEVDNLVQDDTEANVDNEPKPLFKHDCNQCPKYSHCKIRE